MSTSLTLWSEILFVLLAGVTIVWLGATIACRLTTQAHWQRVIWQIAVLAVGALLICEVCGLSRGLLEVASQWKTTPTATVSEPAPLAAEESSARHSVPHTEYSVLTTQYPVLEPVPESEPIAASLPSSNPWLIAWIWPVITLALLARLLLGQSLLVLFARRHAAPGDLRISLLARRLRIARRVRVLRARKLAGPVAFGLLRPTIGLPLAFEKEFSAGEQDAMLAHELAHLANHDPAWRLGTDLLVAALWWHPLAWMIRSRFQAACEAAADEACLIVEDGPQLLAGCLLALAKRVSPAPAIGWLAVEGNGFRSSLGRRVVRLLSLPSSRRSQDAGPGAMVRLMSPAVLLAVVLVSTAWARPRAALTGETSMRNIFTSSWRQSLAGGLLTFALSTGVATADEPKKEGDRPAAERREETRKDGDRPAAERRDGDRPAGERRDGDRPAAERRDGDRPPAERRDGDRPAARRDGEPERPAARREGERGQGDRPVPPPPRRDADRPDAPREGARPGQPDRARMEEELARLKRAAAEHREAGRREEAERAEQAIRNITARLDGRGEGAPGRPPVPREGGRDVQPPRDGRGGEGPRPDDLINVLRDLQREVQNLRGEVNELRDQVKRLSGRGEGR